MWYFPKRYTALYDSQAFAVDASAKIQSDDPSYPPERGLANGIETVRGKSSIWF